MAAPVFIDAAHAAEMLHMTQEALLDLIRARKLRTYGGHASNPFVRSADISALIKEVGVPEEPGPAKRTKSAHSRVQTRLTADSRWAELSDEDIKEWATQADPVRRQAARKAAEIARRRLETVLAQLEELQS